MAEFKIPTETVTLPSKGAFYSENNPLSKGSYSAIKPGCYGARELLSEPVAEKLIFAGEATAGDLAGLVNGAYESGKMAATRISNIIKLKNKSL